MKRKILLFGTLCFSIYSLFIFAEPAYAVAADSFAANDDSSSLTIPAERKVVIDVLANDSGNNLRITKVGKPKHGSAWQSGSWNNPSITYQPTWNYIGEDSFTYQVKQNGSGKPKTATVNIIINGPDVPVANDDSATTNIRKWVSIPVLSNDTPDGITFNWNYKLTPSHGSAWTNGKNIVYQPNWNYDGGTDSFKYGIMDNYGRTATATITVTVEKPELNAADDSYVLRNMTPLGNGNYRLDVMSNDIGNSLSFDGIKSNPSHGTASINGSNLYYKPTAGYSGMDSFTYGIKDNLNQKAVGTVTIEVGNNIAPPIVNDDTAETAFEETVSVDVLENDIGVGLTIDSIDTLSPSGSGTASISGKSIQFIPGSEFYGNATINYTVKDIADQTATGKLVISVNKPTPPTTAQDTAVTDFQTDVTIDVLSNDTGTGLTLQTVGVPIPGGSGTASIENGKITYYPSESFYGSVNISYTVKDIASQIANGAVSVVVNPPAAPELNPDSAETAFGVVKTVNVLANDTGSSISIESVTEPSPSGSGSAVVVGDSIIYTPGENFFGTATMEYTVKDIAGQTATETLTVNVGKPTPPVIVKDQKAGTPENTQLEIDVLDNDIGTGLSIASIVSPTTKGGTASIIENKILFTPKQDWTGKDTVRYTVKDIAEQTADGQIDVQVGINELIAENDMYNLGDINPDSQGRYKLKLTENDSGTSIKILSVTQPEHGSVQIKDNNFVYFVPEAEYGENVSFNYTLTDKYSNTADATVTIELPEAPAALEDTAETDFNKAVTIDVLANDKGSGLSVKSVQNPSEKNNKVQITSNKIKYTPQNSFYGEDFFTYTLEDRLGRTAEAQVTVTVANPSIVAVDDYINITNLSKATTLNVLKNDIGSEKVIDSIESEPEHGSVEIINRNTRIKYTPLNGTYKGEDSFKYVFKDKYEQSVIGTVYLYLGELPATSAVDDNATTDPATSVSISVLSNDNGAFIRIVDVETPENGSVQISGDSILYTPNINFQSDTDSFTYTIEDGFGNTASAVVYVTVTGEGGGGNGGLSQLKQALLDTTADALSNIDETLITDSWNDPEALPPIKYYMFKKVYETLKDQADGSQDPVSEEQRQIAEALEGKFSQLFTLRSNLEKSHGVDSEVKVNEFNIENQKAVNALNIYKDDFENQGYNPTQ